MTVVVSKSMEWIKLYCALPDDPKIKELRRGPDGDMCYLIWLNVLMLAGKCGTDGKLLITKGVPYTAAAIADDLGFQQSLVEKSLERFVSLNLLDVKVTNSNALRNAKVTLDRNACVTPDRNACAEYDITENVTLLYTVCNWNTYQSGQELERIRSKNAQRQARFRKKQKAASQDNAVGSGSNAKSNVTSNVTHNVTHNVTVTPEKSRVENSSSDKHYYYSRTGNVTGGSARPRFEGERALPSSAESSEIETVKAELAALQDLPPIKGATVSRQQLRRQQLEQRLNELQSPQHKAAIGEG